MYLVHRSALKEDVLEIGVLFKEVRFSELDFAEEVEFRNWDIEWKGIWVLDRKSIDMGHSSAAKIDGIRH